MTETRPLPVSSAPPPPPVNVAGREAAPERPKNPDQWDANIEFYADLFGRCLDAAERVLLGKLPAPDGGFPRMKFDLATTLFERLFSDQMSLQNAARQADAVIAGMHRVLESRR